VCVKRPMKMQTCVVVIEGRCVIEVAVEEHAGLEHRERVRVFHTRGHPLAILSRDEAEWSNGSGFPDLRRAPVRVSAVCVELPEQFSNGLMPEELLDSEVQSLFSGQRDDAHAADGVAAEIEEIILNACAAAAEHLFPHCGQRALCFRSRCNVL